MPDGYEWVYDLNPRDDADKYGDPDGDGLQNYREYEFGIVGSWNMSRSWPIENATDPKLNDTDLDGMTDWYENSFIQARDADGDGLSNGVDDDSDADGLGDWIEWAGWDSGYVEASLVRALAVDPSLPVNDTDFEWTHVTSDPFVADWDGDGLNDWLEFENLSNPRSNDTDLDFALDSTDLVVNSTNASDLFYLAAFQDITPPTIWLNEWQGDVQACGFGPFCANITFSVTDPQGVKRITFTHIGKNWTTDFTGMYTLDYVLQGFGWKTVVSDWILIPLVGAADYNGGFQILVRVEDSLGNVNSSIFSGGDVLVQTQKFVDALRTIGFESLRTHVQLSMNASASMVDLADFVGSVYGFEMAAINAFAGFDDSLNGGWYPGKIMAGILGGTWEGLGSLGPAVGKVGWAAQHPFTCDPAGDVHYEGRWSYANTIALGVNPFDPTFDDVVNLSTKEGVFSMFCQVYADPANASNFTKWFVGFYDGSVKGGAVYQAIMIVGSLYAPGMTFAGLAASLLKVGRAVVGLTKALWAGVKTAVGAAKAAAVGLVLKIIQIEQRFWNWMGLKVDHIVEWMKNVKSLAGFSRASKAFESDPRYVGELTGTSAAEVMARGGALRFLLTSDPTAQLLLATRLQAAGHIGKALGQVRAARMAAGAEFSSTFQRIVHYIDLPGHSYHGKWMGFSRPKTMELGYRQVLEDAISRNFGNGRLELYQIGASTIKVGEPRSLVALVPKGSTYRLVEMETGRIIDLPEGTVVFMNAQTGAIRSGYWVGMSQGGVLVPDWVRLNLIMTRQNWVLANLP